VQTIQLKTGEYTFVDDEDFDRVKRYKWHIAGPGYVARSYRENGKPKTEYLHHFIFGLKIELDHKNGNPLDNQKNNLRPASDAQNQANTLKPHRKSKYSRFHGVTMDKRRKIRKWLAFIGHERTYLGNFESKEAAARAYDKARIKRYGEYARTNFPTPT
jgi:hypothetical protein